jgi:hypothetical protein
MTLTCRFAMFVADLFESPPEQREKILTDYVLAAVER